MSGQSNILLVGSVRFGTTCADRMFRTRHGCSSSAWCMRLPVASGGSSPRPASPSQNRPWFSRSIEESTVRLFQSLLPAFFDERVFFGRLWPCSLARPTRVHRILREFNKASTMVCRKHITAMAPQYFFVFLQASIDNTAPLKRANDHRKSVFSVIFRPLLKADERCDGVFSINMLFYTFGRSFRVHFVAHDAVIRMPCSMSLNYKPKILDLVNKVGFPGDFSVC